LRRVHHAHVAALGLDGEQVLLRSRHAQHVPERAEHDSFAPRQRDGFVDQVDRRDADRAPRSVDQGEVRGQELIDAVAEDGVGLAAADFHDGPWPRDSGANGARQAARLFRVAEFVEELHARHTFKAPSR
jgi:hypothetical protein